MSACAVVGVAPLVAALTPPEAAPVIQTIRGLIPNNRDERVDFVGGIVHLAAHDALGANGAESCIERGLEDNAGLNAVIDELEAAYQQHAGTLSRADFWALASIVSIRSVGGPPVRFNWGRRDCSRPEGVSDSDFLPLADPDGDVWTHIKSMFQRQI